MLASAGGSQTRSMAGGKACAGGSGRTSAPTSLMLAQIAQKPSVSCWVGPAGASEDPNLRLVITACLESAETRRHSLAWRWPKARANCKASAKSASQVVGRVLRRNQRIHCSRYYHTIKLNEHVRKGKSLSRSRSAVFD